jgi:hypothetical protein
MTAQDEMIVARNKLMVEKKCSAGIAMSLLCKTNPELVQRARDEATEAARHPSLRRAA